MIPILHVGNRDSQFNLFRDTGSCDSETGPLRHCKPEGFEQGLVIGEWQNATLPENLLLPRYGRVNFCNKALTRSLAGVFPEASRSAAVRIGLTS